MKFEWNKKYAQIAFWVCVVILFTVMSVFFFLNYNDFDSYVANFMSVMNPIIYGVVIAYILNKIMKIYETKVFRFMDKKPGKMRMKRTLSILCTYITFIAVLVGFIMLIGPQILAGFNDLKNNIPFYIDAAEEWLLALSEENETFHDLVFDMFAYINDLVDQLGDIVAEIMPKITEWLSGSLPSSRTSRSA